MKMGGYAFVESSIPEITAIGAKKGVQLMVGPDELANRFAGVDVGNIFRVPAADKKTDMFFSNRELLARFTSLTLPAQATFLKCVRRTMDEAGCNVMHLMIKWSKEKERVLRITGHVGLAGGLHEGHLDFELL